MQIPGGDLAPARRRQYGGGYGRRRRRRNQRLAFGAVLVLVGGASAYLLRQDDAAVPDRVAQQPVTCVTPTATPTAVGVVQRLPRPQQVRIALLNGTPRNGLAKSIGDQLAARGFVVTAQGNAPAALAGPSQVAYPVGAEAAATVVARWVQGATTVVSPRVPRGTVQVTLGSAFRRLSTPAEAAAPAAPVASPTPTATPTGCAS